MNPDEFRDFQSEAPRENQTESTNPPKPIGEQASPSEDPWGGFGDEEDEVDGVESLVQDLTEEDASLLQAEDNFLQAFMEPEPTATPVDLFATPADATAQTPADKPGVDLFATPSEPTVPALNREPADLFATAPEPPLPPERSPTAPAATPQPSLTEPELPPNSEVGEAPSSHPFAMVEAIASGQPSTPVVAWEQRVAELQRQEQALKQEISALQATQAQLKNQILEAQGSLGRLVQEGLKELEQRKQTLQISVEQLERRQERIRSEMRTTFAGVSQDLAIRVQSFKDYLVGSLQDLALSAEQLELPKPSREPDRRAPAPEAAASAASPTPRFAEQNFQEQTRKIRSLLDQYRNRPDYYGAPWNLRRTFEPIHAERVSSWFFTQGGRGAIRTLGSRLQNILVASATISILYALYGDRLRALVLAESPERLGEWRRGLQDCLGITRGDFGPERGVALFEDPEVLAQKADRSLKDGAMPFVVMDETEEQISLAILQFPLWLAFAPNPQASSSYTRDW